MIKSIEWSENKLTIIDQTEIPRNLIYLELNTIQQVFEAIQKLRVRGAPAIGVAAAFGLYLGVRGRSFENRQSFLSEAKSLADYLASARPTAVNLRWALQFINEKLQKTQGELPELIRKVLEIAIDIKNDDQKRCDLMGSAGAELIQPGMRILTHCNTGALATAGIGTALGVIYTAHRQNKKLQVFVDETRPLLQGARLNMWELEQAGIPATLISDNMAAYAMQRGMIDLVIVGADRIAANGDTANKIGTYNLAVNAQYHGIPFYVAAPLSTFDFSIKSGEQIPIEERNCEEITRIWGKLPITVENASCWNPAFDVTPAGLITGIITEAGIADHPFEDSLTRLKLNSQVHKNHKELIQ
ncbi:MAG: S-methyl-5-thioribose-1-phosphate isomerase [Calditrichia bacterium]